MMIMAVMKKKLNWSSPLQLNCTRFYPTSIRRWPIIHRPGLLSLLDWPIKKSRQLPKHPCNGAGKRYILYLLGAFILFSSDAKYIVRTTNFGNLGRIFYFDSEIEKISNGPQDTFAYLEILNSYLKRHRFLMKIWLKWKHKGQKISFRALISIYELSHRILYLCYWNV